MKKIVIGLLLMTFAASASADVITSIAFTTTENESTMHTLLYRGGSHATANAIANYLLSLIGGGRKAKMVMQIGNNNPRDISVFHFGK